MAATHTCTHSTRPDVAGTWSGLYTATLITAPVAVNVWVTGGCIDNNEVNHIHTDNSASSG